MLEFLDRHGLFLVTVSAAIAILAIALTAALANIVSADVRNYGLVIIAVAAVPFAIWRSIVAQRQAVSARSQAEAATAQAELARGQADALRHEQIETRFFRSVEMLGSAHRDIRFAGAQMLQRLSVDHPADYHELVEEVLEVHRLEWEAGQPDAKD